MLYLTIMLIGIDPAMFCLARPTEELQYSAALIEKCAKEGKTLVVQKGETAKKEAGKVYCVSNLDVIPKGVTEYVPNKKGDWLVEKAPAKTVEKTAKSMKMVCGPNGCTLVGPNGESLIYPQGDQYDNRIRYNYGFQSGGCANGQCGR